MKCLVLPKLLNESVTHQLSKTKTQVTGNGLLIIYIYISMFYMTK